MQIIKSPILKILICFCLAFTFLFVQPKEKMPEAEAALPAILLAVLGSIVLDIAIDMGIDFVDKQAGKKWADNIVGKLWNKYGTLISDLRPTKTNAGKWALNIGKNLLSLIVAEITTSVDDVAKKDEQRKKENSDEDGDGILTKHEAGVDLDTSDPFYNTSVYIRGIELNDYKDTVQSRKAVAYLNEWVSHSFKPKSYAQKTEWTMFIDNVSSVTYELPGGFDGTFYVGFRDMYNSGGLDIDGTALDYPYMTSNEANFSWRYDYIESGSPKDLIILNPTPNGSSPRNGIWKGYLAFEKYLERLENQNIKTYYADGVLVTEGYEAYINLPDNINTETLDKIDYSKLPPALQNDREFEFDIGDSTVIDAEYEVINEGDEFEWDIIEQDIVNQGDTIYHYEVDNNYSPTINNYYTVSPEQQEEIENEITIIINNPPAEGGDNGEGSTDGFMYCVDKPGAMVVSCKDIEAVDGSILTYLKNSYDYAVNAVKTGSDGLKTIVEGSAGLIALYSNIFDWLPDEVTILLTSGLLLMIGLRVFRR